MTPETDHSPDSEMNLDQLEALVKRLFKWADSDQPILGMTDNDIVAPNIREMLKDPRNTVATLSEKGEIIGFSLAIPIGVMDPARADESRDTAYIYFTGITPEWRRKGKVGEVMEKMVRLLRAKGYSFIERDCVLTQEKPGIESYADKVERAYRGAIIDQKDHERWPEVGPERFFRIELSKIM